MCARVRARSARAGCWGGGFGGGRCGLVLLRAGQPVARAVGAVAIAKSVKSAPDHM